MAAIRLHSFPRSLQRLPPPRGRLPHHQDGCRTHPRNRFESPPLLLGEVSLARGYRSYMRTMRADFRDAPLRDLSRWPARSRPPPPPNSAGCQPPLSPFPSRTPQSWEHARPSTGAPIRLIFAWFQSEKGALLRRPHVPAVAPLAHQDSGAEMLCVLARAARSPREAIQQPVFSS